MHTSNEKEHSFSTIIVAYRSSLNVKEYDVAAYISVVEL